MRAVARPVSYLQYPRITAVSFLVLWRDFIEKLGNHFLLSHEGHGPSPRSHVPCLAERYHPLGVVAEFLGLRHCGLNPAALKERVCQVGHQAPEMAKRPRKTLIV